MTSLLIIPKLINSGLATRLFVLLCFLLFTFSGFSQNRKALEQKRKQLLEDIQKADRLLRATTKNKEANLNRLMTLQTQIKKREELVITLKAELAFADSSIRRTDRVVHALQFDLENLEEEYSEIARQAYRQKKTGNPLFFIFSAEGINQAFKRWQYLRQYEDFRNKQAELMVATKETLRLKIGQQEKQRVVKRELINAAGQQRNILQKEKSDKKEMVQALKKDEQSLRNQLAEKRNSHEELNRAIEDVIHKQILVSRKTARTPEALNNTNTAINENISSGTATSERIRVEDARDRKVPEVVARNFLNKKGRLSWPVENGVITGRYGKQPHPTLKRIQITNNGVDIQTGAGGNVFAVFEGEVAGVQFIPGNHHMVIIKHGNYYTVYSNLEVVEVEKGDTVDAKETIGYLHVNEKTNTSEVHFEVWKDKKRMNPVRWIR